MKLKQLSPEEALEDLSHGLEEIPELPHVLAARAEILITRDRYDMARDDLERAFEMEPDNPHIRIQLAYLVLLEDRTDMALDIIRHPESEGTGSPGKAEKVLSDPS